MKLIEKILVGIDFGPTSDKAMHEAIRVSKKFGSSIVLVHIIPDIEMTKLNEEMIHDSVSKEMQLLAEKLNDEGISVKTIIEKGVPFIQIMEIAELQDVNVIMIGAGDAPNKTYGLTAEKLMNKSNKPVWVVTHERKSEPKKVLCPIDFSPASDRALENAIHISRQFDLELTVLHVVDVRKSRYFSKGFSHEVSGKGRSGIDLESYLKKFDFHNVRWNKLIREGSPAEEILEQVQLQGADLLLMGSIGKTAHPKMLTGSTARLVFRSVPTTMIVFKSEDIIQLKLQTELKDIGERFQQGAELMENGFVRDAIAHFKYCLNEDPLFAPAWELLADAYYRLGEQQKAMDYKAKAAEIRDKLWKQRVESEIKNRHTLYKSN